MSEEIRRIVADAVTDGGMISASKCAAQIVQTYRGCGLSEREIANRIMMAAASANVAVELGAQRERSVNRIGA